MREFLNITKALSDESRVRALMALADGELCVCQIIELLSLAPSTVSKHMAVLHQAGLVETRKEGRWIFYRLAEEPGLPCAKQALAMARECLAKDGRIREDAKKLKCVRKMTREELCRHYKTC
jgi:DNA-binding transcriptional ArsR family regulator